MRREEKIMRSEEKRREEKVMRSEEKRGEDSEG